MAKRQIRILALAIVLCMALVFVPFLAQDASAALVAVGYCGDNVSWCLYDEGTLNIYGTGPMSSYQYGDWDDYDVYKVIIGNGVTTIGDYAFFHCEFISSVTIPSSVTKIGNSAFYECESLTSITIPSSVTSIGECAFYNCDSLTSVTIPGSVTKIGDSAFSGCDGLTKATIQSGVQTIGKAAFSGCDSLTSVTIPSSVTKIGNSAFSSCGLLTAVTIPYGVTSIGEDAFRNCDSLKNITIPGSVTKIGDHAFYDCSSMTKATIQNGVQTIGEYAFAYCKGLTSVTIPASVTNIGKSAFSNYYDLDDVYYGGSAAQWEAINGSGRPDFAEIHYNSVLPPEITKQPASVAAAVGKTVSFTVKASGKGLTYQWKYSKDSGKTWANSSSTGYNTATMSVEATSARNGYLYRCVVKNSAGSVTSSSAKLSAGTAPKITTQPASVTVAAGNQVKFTVKASGTGLTYRWQYSKDGGSNWSNSSSTGYNTATMTVEATSARNGYLYRCVVKNSFGSVTSSAAKLTTGAAPKITTQPASAGASSGSTVKFTVKASGTSLTYQWQYSKDNGSTWSNSSATGYNTATMSVGATSARNGYLYRVVVKNSFGSVTSNAAKLSVGTAPKITAQPSSIAAASGKTVKFTVKATGTDLTYQWQFSKDGGSTWSNSSMTGYNTASMSVGVTAARDGYLYRVVVKNGIGSVTSASAELTLMAPPDILDEGAEGGEWYYGYSYDTLYCARGDVVSFYVSPDGEGLTYQWQYSKDGGSTWLNSSMSGYNTGWMNVEVTGARDGYMYRCVVKNDAGKVISKPIKIVIDEYYY